MNQIQTAIRWGQRSNFLAVPSDASQRDERLGWTGDIQAFASTGVVQRRHVAASSASGCRRCAISQDANGAFPDVAPVSGSGEGTAGWGDAGTVVPFALYKHYGDPRILQASYDSMKRWIAYLQANSSGLIRPNSGYGDWLATDNTALDFIGTAYFAYCTDLTRQAATILGNDADAATYASLYSQIKSAFVSRWVHADGTVGSGSQTSYVLALKFGLVPDDAEGCGLQAPRRRRRQPRRTTSRTGFLGTPFLLNVLQDGGRGDLAYKVLTQDTLPELGLHAQPAARRRSGSAGTASAPTARSRTRG